MADLKEGYLRPVAPEPPGPSPRAEDGRGFLSPSKAPLATPEPVSASEPAQLSEERVRDIRQSLDALARFDNERSQGRLAAFLPVLFPDATAAELLRNRRGARQVRDRLYELREHLTLADRDGGILFKRDRVKSARKALDRAEAELGGEEGFADAVQHQLHLVQRTLFEREVERHAAIDPETGQSTRKLYGSDLLKVDADARRLGFTAEEGRRIAAELGYDLLATEARAWTPVTAIPGAPVTLDAVALALIEHRVMAVQWLRLEIVSSWLVRNGADAGLVDAARQAERALRGGAHETAALHALVWALGRTDLLLSVGTVRTPAALAARLRDDPSFGGELEQLAREGVLASWFERHGAVAAAVITQRMIAQGADGRAVTREIQALRWALGEPLELANLKFSDVPSLAQAILAQGEVRDAALRALKDGRLAAWVESLPESEGLSGWAERLRGTSGRAAPDRVGLWWGVFRATDQRTLRVRSADGALDGLTDPRQFLQTAWRAQHWDGLKERYESGELLAWLELTLGASPVVRDAARRFPEPRHDEALNRLAWDLGARGLVLEWGTPDRAVDALDELARCYLEAPAKLATALGDAHVFDWIQARVREVGSAREQRLIEFALPWVRERAPEGARALAVALLAGLPVLPQNAQQPGDPDNADTFKGFVGVAKSPGATPELWRAARAQLSDGTALLWIACGGSDGVGAGKVGKLIERAYREKTFPLNDDEVTRLARELTEQVGVPQLSPASLKSTLGGSFSWKPPVALPAPPSPVRPPRSVLPRILAGVSALAAVGGGLFLLKDDLRAGLLENPSQVGDPVRLRETADAGLVGCALETGFVALGAHVEGRVDTVMSLTSAGVGVGWTVRAGGNNGTETPAMAFVSLTGAPPRVVIPEAPTEDRNTEFSPVTVTRVTPVRDANAPSEVIVDRVERTATSDTVRCGEVSSTYAVVRSVVGLPPPLPDLVDGSDDEPQGAPASSVEDAGPAVDVAAMYFCRTVGATRPFVVGLRAATTPDGRVDGRAVVFATRTSVAEGVPVDTVGVHLQRALRDSNPLGELRQEAAEAHADAQAVEFPGSGWGVVWRYGRAVSVGWLDANLRPMGAFTRLPLLGGSPGRVSIAHRGQTLALVVADRERHSRGSPERPFRVRALTAIFGSSPGAVTDLDTAAVPSEEQVDPDIQPVGPSSWLVTWTSQTTSGPSVPHTWMRRYGEDLSPREAPVSVLANASDARLVASGDRFALTLRQGRSSSRELLVSVGRCGGGPELTRTLRPASALPGSPAVAVRPPPAAVAPPAAPAVVPAPGPGASLLDPVVTIPAGTFPFGAPPGETVSVSAFRMDRFEVTVARYAGCVGAGRCPAPPATSSAEPSNPSLCNATHTDRGQHPINCLPWSAADGFCRWARGRLPTEVEWEYAARGTDGRRYPWGDDEPTVAFVNACDQDCAVTFGVRALFPTRSDGWATTAPIGSFPRGASPFGVQDLSGNVSEWTATRAVARGGGWRNGEPSGVSPLFRDRNPRNYRGRSIGFRCVYDIEASSEASERPRGGAKKPRETSRR